MSELIDDRVRAVIAKSYGEELAACKAMLDFAVIELQPWPGRPIKMGADRIILAEAARATKSFDAVIRLGEAGFGEQAAMLNRSLFEGMAVAHWVSDNRREAVSLFTRHGRFSALLWHETFDALGWLDDAELKRPRSVSPKERKQLVALFGRYGTKPWVGRSVPKLLTAIEHQWDEKGRRDLWAFHNVPYRLTNQMLHSTPISTGAAVTRHTSAALHVTIGPSSQFVSQALFSAYWTYGQLFSLLVDVYKVSSRQAFRDIYESGGEVFCPGTDVGL